MNETWKALTHGHRGAPGTIQVKGREIEVPIAAGPSARFDFADLCERPLGARDYLAIAARYSTLVVEHVPILSEGRRNEAKRLILLIDTLYDHRARLVMSAEAPPNELYVSTRGTEGFEFDRTVSRLIEMQSRDWLDDWASRHPSAVMATPDLAGAAD